MHGKVIFTDLQGRSMQVRIFKRHTYVGKNKNCDIRIEHNNVDDTQFVIAAGNKSAVKIQNLSKKYPMRLNKQLIDFDAQHDLKENDVITVGDMEILWTYKKVGDSPAALQKHVSAKRPRVSEPARKVAVVTPNFRQNVFEEEEEVPTKRPRHICQAGPYTPQPSAFARRSMYDRALKSKTRTPSARGRPGLCTPTSGKKRIGFAELGTPKLQYDHAAAFNNSITPRTFFGHSGPPKPFAFGANGRVAGTSREDNFQDSCSLVGGRRSGRVSTPFPNKNPSFTGRTPKRRGPSGPYFPAVEEDRFVPSPGRRGEAGFSMDDNSSMLIPPIAAHDSTPSSYFSPGSGSPRRMRAESPKIPTNAMSHPGLPYHGRKSLLSSNSSFATPQGGYHDSREQDSMYVNATSRSQSQMRDSNDSQFPENNGHYGWSSPGHQNAYPMTSPLHPLWTPKRSSVNESPGSAKFSPCDASYVLLSPRGRSIAANRGYGNSQYSDSRLVTSSSRSDFNFTASPGSSKSHLPKTVKRSLSMQLLARSLQNKLHRSMSGANLASVISSGSPKNAAPVISSPFSNGDYGDPSSSSSNPQGNVDIPRENMRGSGNIESPKGRTPTRKSIRNDLTIEVLPQEDGTPRKSRSSARRSINENELSSQLESSNNQKSRASQKREIVDSSASPRRSQSSRSQPLSPSETDGKTPSEVPSKKRSIASTGRDVPTKTPRSSRSTVDDVQPSTSVRRSRSSRKADDSRNVSAVMDKSRDSVQQGASSRRSRSVVDTLGSPPSPDTAIHSEMASSRRSNGNRRESLESLGKRKSDGSDVLSNTSVRRSSGKNDEITKASSRAHDSNVSVQRGTPRRSRTAGDNHGSPSSPDASNLPTMASSKRPSVTDRESLKYPVMMKLKRATTSPKIPKRSSLPKALEEVGSSRSSTFGSRRAKSVPALNTKSADGPRGSARPTRRSMREVPGRSSVSIRKSTTPLANLGAVTDKRSSKRLSTTIQGDTPAMQQTGFNRSQDTTEYISDLSAISGPRKSAVGFGSPTLPCKVARVTSTPFPRTGSQPRVRKSESFDPLSTLSVDTTVAQSSYMCSDSPAYDTIITDRDVCASEANKGTPKASLNAPTITITEASPAQKNSMSTSPEKRTFQRRSSQRSVLPATPPKEHTPPIDLKTSRNRSSVEDILSTPTSSFRKNPRRKVKRPSSSASIVRKLMMSLSPSKKLSIDPEKPDKKKMAALIACHKKKSPLKGSHLNVPGASQEEDLNVTLTPLKDLDKQPENTSPEDALLNALDLSRKSTLTPKPQKPARRLRSSALKRHSLPVMIHPKTPPCVPAVTKSVKKLLFKSPLVEYENSSRSPKKALASARAMKSILIPSPTTSSDEPMSRIFSTSPVMDFTDSSGKKKSFRASPTSKSSVIKELIPAEEIYLEDVRNLFETSARNEGNSRPSSTKRGRKGNATEVESHSKGERESPKATPARNTRSLKKATQEDSSPTRTRSADGSKYTETPNKKSDGATSKAKTKVTSQKGKKAVKVVLNDSYKTASPASRRQTRVKKTEPAIQEKLVTTKKGTKTPIESTSPTTNASKKMAVSRKRVSLVVRKVSLTRPGKSTVGGPKKSAMSTSKAKQTPSKALTERKKVSSPKAQSRTTRGASSKAGSPKIVVTKKRTVPAKTKKSHTEKVSAVKTQKSAATKKSPSPAKPKKTGVVPKTRLASPRAGPSNRATSPKKSAAPKKINASKKRTVGSASAKSSPAMKAGKAVLVRKRASLAKPKKTTRDVKRKTSSKSAAKKVISPKAGPSRTDHSPIKHAKERGATESVSAKKSSPSKSGKAALPKKKPSPAKPKKPARAAASKSSSKQKPDDKTTPKSPKKVANKADSKKLKAPAVASLKRGAKDKTPPKPPTPRKTRSAANKK